MNARSFSSWSSPSDFSVGSARTRASHSTLPESARFRAGQHLPTLLLGQQDSRFPLNTPSVVIPQGHLLTFSTGIPSAPLEGRAVFAGLLGRRHQRYAVAGSNCIPHSPLPTPGQLYQGTRAKGSCSGPKSPARHTRKPQVSHQDSLCGALLQCQDHSRQRRERVPSSQSPRLWPDSARPPRVLQWRLTDPPFRFVTLDGYRSSIEKKKRGARVRHRDGERICEHVIVSCVIR